MVCRFNLFIALLTATAALLEIAASTNVTTQFYTIVPSTHHPCPSEPCITLAQFASDTDSYVGVNTTLNFLPGSHVLDYELRVENIQSFSMTPASNYTLPLLTTIVCSLEGYLMLKKIDVIEIEGLAFTGCSGNGIAQAGKLIITDSNFVGRRDNNSNGEFMFDIFYSYAVIDGSNFTEHTNGQALHFAYTSGKVTRSIFSNNEAIVILAYSSTLYIKHSLFHNNSLHGSGVGAAIYADYYSIVSIMDSNFSSNYVENISAAIHAVQYSTLHLHRCQFHKNVAGNMGGVLSLFLGSISNVTDCVFSHNSAANSGGALVVYQSTMVLERTLFLDNYAENGGAIFAYKRGHILAYNTSFINNKATYTIVFLLNSFASFLNHTTYSNNSGSLLVFNGRVTFNGNTNFFNNSDTLQDADTKRITDIDEGGAITAFQSEVVFEGNCQLVHNRAKAGGAIHAIQSKFYVYGNLTVSNNTAAVDGGGAYLTQSDIMCRNQSLVKFEGNIATEKGGGVHAISSSISVDFTVYDYNPYDNPSVINYVFTGSMLSFTANKAAMGGGVYLESQAKLYVLKESVYLDSGHPIYSLTFSSNAAQYGGAVYVADETNWSTCNRTQFRMHSLSTTADCFLQTLALHGRRYLSLNLVNTKFELNVATEAGSMLFGGLLDRCTVNTFAEVYYKDADFGARGGANGLKYLLNTSTFQITDSKTVSSHPVRLCFCKEQRPACGFQPPTLHVRKGENFTLSVVAVDQMNNSISYTSVNSFLSSNEGILGNRKALQDTGSGCSSLTFTAYSLRESEELIMYAEGPCRNANKSLLRQKIKFLPCECPVGFKQDTSDKKVCDCKCDPQLRPYITECNATKGVLLRNGDFWISYVNESDSYVVYPHCPLQYCQLSTTTVEIDFSNLNGTDTQCTVNRYGVLCGACKPGLSLSLSSSKCVSCPVYWPALFAAIVIASLVAGVLLVAIVLVLNLTVAVGTLNGVFFYANIVNINKSLLFPFPMPNYVTVFISWLNLEPGFDTCFIEGMDAYWKTWLQLVFPLYIILLVILVIVLCQYSQRFAHLIGKKNPVATLATLILLSYDKLLHTAITAFSFATLKYPDGEKQRVWLLDANVKYLSGKHIPLFLCAIVILVVCILYTGLLLTWQWLLRCPNYRLLRWTRNQKLHLFLKTYHAPYTIKHRYWPGFLLVVRAALSISSAFNTANDPGLSLVCLGVFMILLLFLVGRCSPVYENSLLEFVEVTIYVNITVLFAFSLFALESGREQTVIAYISGTVAIVQFLLVIAHHVFSEFIQKRCTFMRGKNENKELTNYPQAEFDRKKPTHTSLDRFCGDPEFLSHDHNDNGDNANILGTDSGIDYEQLNENSPLISRPSNGMYSGTY